MEKITNIIELDKILKEEFSAVDSSIEEINSDEECSLVGDKEHDYSFFDRAYKIKKANNEYDYFIIFSKNEKLSEFKYIGIADEKMVQLWNNVEWDD